MVMPTECDSEEQTKLMAKNIEKRKQSLPEKLQQGATAATDWMQDSQFWTSVFRPGSIFRKGYTESPRNRSYVIMNSVLYHLHPVKVKRHAVKVSYTLCLGGLSFFLFILLTIQKWPFFQVTLYQFVSIKMPQEARRILIYW